MGLEETIYSGQIPNVRILLFLVIEIAFFIYILVKNHIDGANEPTDDSHLTIDKEKMKEVLKQFIGTNQEEIIGILGKKNLNDNVNDNGFCFLTDKAYYFIGDVLQKEHFFTWKTNIQDRIVANEMKGIEIKNYYPLSFIVFPLYTAFCFCWNLKFLYLWVSATSCYAESLTLIEQFCSAMSILAIIPYFVLFFYGIVNLIKKRKTIDIRFTTQTIRFPIGELGKQEINDFYKSVSQSQETINSIMKADNGKNIENTYAEANAIGKSKVEALAELSKLYEQKLIGQEEFEKLKKEIING